MPSCSRVAHPDEGAQKVFETDVGAYFAGRDGAIQQGGDGFRQAIECIGVEFRRAVHSQRQRPRHALFCSDELDIGAQPARKGSTGNASLFNCSATSPSCSTSRR
jgi:hypothetical protein